MPRKIRSDSLYAQLTPEQRDMLFEWLLDEGISYVDAANLCVEKFGLNPSVPSLCGFMKQHGFSWRMDRAKEIANDKATSLPANFDAKKRAALAQREFEKACNELTSQEIIAFQRLDLDRQIAKTQGEIELEKLKISRIKLDQKERGMKFDREKFAVSTCELFLKWSADEKACSIAAAPISNKEKIEQLRQLYFADVDALEAAGTVKIPE
jgi:hypothetical protein